MESRRKFSEKTYSYFSIANRNSLHPIRTKNLRFPTTNLIIKERFTKSDMRTRERKLIPIHPISRSWKTLVFPPKLLNVPWHRLQQIADFPRTRKMTKRRTRTLHRQLQSISEPEAAAPPLRRKVSLKKQQPETFSSHLLRCSDPRSQFYQYIATKPKNRPFVNNLSYC